MRRCLELAAKGRGFVGNGALVGSVLVRKGKIIAEGFHSGFGEPHAERALLESYKGKIEPEDILYVNLEPCLHHGKTPPCADLIIEKGIKHVVYGMVDPDLRVSGSGISKLQKAGIDVRGPVLQEECRWLNRGFVSLRTKDRPWVTLKMAQTRAGKVLNADGVRLMITSEKQDEWAHTFLRARHDAILVGANTVIADDPKLTTRFIKNPPHLYRIILDPTLRISEDSFIIKDHPESTIVIVREDMFSADAFDRLIKKGIKIFPIPFKDDEFEWLLLWKVLTTPVSGFNGITSILVEGGSRTWELFRTSHVMDQEVILVGT